MIRLSFYGSGFLRYMVRMIARTLMEAGKRKISLEEIREMLEKKDKEACHYNGEAQGLYCTRRKKKAEMPFFFLKMQGERKVCRL